MSLIVDQFQMESRAYSIGSGEFNGVRYRGQVFTPTQSRVDALLFYCQHDGGGTVGFKIHFYNVDQGTNLPTTEIYSFTVAANAYTPNRHNRFVLPSPITGLTPGTKYCFFIAPWNTSTNEYQDYYRDMKWGDEAYAGGVGIENYQGTWSTNSFSLYFQLFYEANGPSFTPDYTQPALPSCPVGGGWRFNCIDQQVVTKSQDWNPDQTERLKQLQEIVDKGGDTVALGVPYDNLVKYGRHVADARTKGLRVFHRSHWQGWEGDDGFTQHVGTQEYLDRTYRFIVDNPDLFAEGDLFGMCVEPNNANDNGNYTFRTPETSGGSFTISKFNDFIKDQVAYANAAFAQIEKSVYTFPVSPSLSLMDLDGQTLDSGTGGDGDGIDDDFVTTYLGGVLAIDHYMSDAYRDDDEYGAKYGSDLDKIKTAFPNCQIFIGEWGYHTTTSVSDAEQKTVFADVVNALQAKDYICGVSFWVQMASSTASMWTDSGGSIVTGGRSATEEVERGFTNTNAACTGSVTGRTAISQARVSAESRTSASSREASSNRQSV